MNKKQTWNTQKEQFKEMNICWQLETNLIMLEIQSNKNKPYDDKQIELINFDSKLKEENNLAQMKYDNFTR